MKQGSFETSPVADMLRIFLGKSDHIRGKPAYEAVVMAARRFGLAGATVFRGNLGFGANSIVHKPNPLRLSSDLPVVIEIVDDSERIQAFLAELGELLAGGGLITLEKVRIIRYAPPETEVQG